MGSSWANHFVSSINYLTRPVGAAAPGCTAYFFLLENPGRGALPVPSPGPLVARGARAYDPRGAWVLRESGSAAGAVEPSPGCQRLGEDAARGQRWPGARKGGLGAGRAARSWDGAGRRQVRRAFAGPSSPPRVCGARVVLAPRAEVWDGFKHSLNTVGGLEGQVTRTPRSLRACGGAFCSDTNALAVAAEYLEVTS